MTKERRLKAQTCANAPRPRAWLLLAAAITLSAVPAAAPPAEAQAAAAPSYSAALALYAQGRQYEYAGKTKEAGRAFASSLAITEQLASLDAQDMDAASLRCWNLFRLGRYADTVSVGKRALLVKDDYRIKETMAEAYYYLGNDEEALGLFAQYIAAAPADDERMSSAYFFIGESYIRLRKYEHADISFSTAVTMESGMYFWWYRLGYVKELLGDYRRAYQAFQRSLELNPSYANAKEALARVRAKAGL